MQDFQEPSDPGRRRLLSAAASLLAFGAGIGAPAQAAADKLGRIISGFPAGAGMDPLVRLLADKLRGKYMAQMLVENRTGAGGRLAIEAVRGAPADGATVLFTPDSPMMVFPHIFKKLSYEPARDFTPVTTLFTIKTGLVAGPAAPVKSMAEYMAWVRQDPKNAVYGSPGAGTMPHFLGAMFARATGLPLTHVAYRGGAALAQDLLGGQLPVAFQPIRLDSVERHVAGKVRVLALAERERTRRLPDVPTFAELGHRHLVLHEGFGLFVPSGTPGELVRLLAQQAQSAMREPDIQAWLERGQADLLLTSGDEMIARLRSGSADWARIVRDTGYTPED